MQVKPFYYGTFSSQSLLSISISDPFPVFNPFPKLNSSIFLPNLLPLSQLHPTHAHQPIRILCSRKNNRRGCSQSQPSNRKMLQLASMIALNLKIFPEPFNSLIAHIAGADWNGVRPEYLILNRPAGRGKKTKRMSNTLAWFVLICLVAGFLSWRISELDLFLRALLFCLCGISLIRLFSGKKAIKEWLLGFLVGIVLMMSSGSRLGKEDVKFWVEKLRTCSPLAQIAIGKGNRNRNRNRNRNGRISK